MKRLLFLIFSLFALVTSWAQKTTVQDNIIKAKDEFWLKANQVTDIVTDTSFVAASNLKLATQLAVKKYTDSRIGGRAYSTATVPTTGYVIKWDGTKWAPAVDAGTTYTGGTGISIAGTVITNTGITGASTAGGDVSGTFSNLQIAANAMGTTEIADNSVSASKIGIGQVTLDKIAQAGATSGQAIAWDGTGWAPATISGGGGGAITGSGTSGLLTKWTGTTAIGNSIIQDNGVNIGVGKSPSFKLDVNGVINAVSHRFSGYSSQITEESGRMLYYVNGSRLDFIDVTGSKFMGRFSDSELGLWNSNGSQQLSFGINTTGSGSGYYNGSFRISQRLMISSNPATPSARVHVIGEGQTSGTYTALFRNSNNDELFNIRDDKAVSVGTASPSSVAKFHVELDAVKTHMIVNYLGNTILSVRNDANVSFGSNAGSFAITTGTNSSAYNGQYFRFSAPSTSATLDNGGLGQVFVLGRSSSSTSGNTTYFSITSDNAFNPTSGNRSMTGFRVHPSINQTGTASGIIYGIDYDPGVTSILGSHYGLLIRSGFSGFNTATPTATLDVNGTARFRNFTTAGNVFTHDASGNLTDITPAALVAAGGGGANISNSNLTSTGSYALNLVNHSLTFDASTSTNTISQSLIFKGKADGVNASQPFTFTDAGGSQLAYIFHNNLGITLAGTTGKNTTIGSGTHGWTAHNLGVFVHPALTSNPTTTGIPAAEWFNSTTNRWMFRINGNLKTVATLEDDLAGMLTTFATDVTPTGASYGNIVDAFTTARTVTLGADMTEGRIYTIKARRNSTNTITVNAASGHTLELDGDPAIGPPTFNMDVGEVFTAQRFGSIIIINR